ncbi:serine/threonine-protein kinase gcn2 [Xylariaceae sp. FL1272]|nr:serine/threonine-protein kinase gcn2 [Xylariaceae sp. FL1272]
MASRNWKSPNPHTPKKFVAASPDTGPKTQYEDTQKDELLVLQAIWGDDFVEHKSANTAWKKSEPTFDIDIKALSNDEFSITLSVVLTATYPKSAPLLSLKNGDSLNESTVFKLQKYIESKPKALAAEGQAEPMIHDLATGLQEILDDAASIKAQGLELPSLEQERAAHEAELARQALELQQAEEKKKVDAALKEEKNMQELLNQEVERQRLKAKDTPRKRPKPLTSSNSQSDVATVCPSRTVEFDIPCMTTDTNGRVIHFTAVADKREYRQGSTSTIFTVRPSVAGAEDCKDLALEEFELRSSSQGSVQLKLKVQAVERLLDSIKEISHRNILKLLNYRIDPIYTEPGWVARILTPLAEKDTLGELIELAGHLDVGKVRAWTADLLGALGFLHSRGIVHQDIHPGNILLFRESQGEIIPKFSDVAYGREMRDICRRSNSISHVNSARSSYWLPPEIAEKSNPNFTQKTDVWDFGIVFLQMIFGLDVLRHHQSPQALVDSLSLSITCEELVTRFFTIDSKKRPRAIELSSSEFLATDAPVVVEHSPIDLHRSQSQSSVPLLTPVRPRRDSSAPFTNLSRYREDYVEEARLGKGGFGEVVKARQKLDGNIYAIKKIIQPSQQTLTNILKEVRLLSQLSHPAVVRYYSTWLEPLGDFRDGDEDSETSSAILGSLGNQNGEQSAKTAVLEMEDQLTTDTGGLDFVSSDHPNYDPYDDIVFGYDDDSNDGNVDHSLGDNIVFEDDSEHGEEEEEEEEEDEEEDEDDDDHIGDDEQSSEADSDEASEDGPHGMASPFRVRSQSDSRKPRVIMYISMEYCDKRTLRDLIQNKLCDDAEEIWRLFRQIVEGLVHIHGLNIVHRDLKPANIFIGLGPDGVGNVKIGDFGLATTGNFAVDRVDSTHLDSGELTSGVGTSFYVAPEVRKGSGGSYTSKVDMYSLGVIFFEMGYYPVMGMERADKLGKLSKESRLPDDFQPENKNHLEIVKMLITHDPTARPSSSELLRSGKLPIQMENENNQRAFARVLSSLEDRDSADYPRVISALFAARRPLALPKDYTWDMSVPDVTAAELLYKSIVKEELAAIFRRHGAVEAPRSSLYPRSTQYSTNQKVVELLDPNGTVVQLPFDLMLGNARFLAKLSKSLELRRSFTFGQVYRVNKSGGQPQMLGEVDFDITSADSFDLALKEAEVIKVLDEICQTFPSTSHMCFHLGHSDLLQLIFDYCKIEQGARQLTAEALSKLNILSHTFQTIRAELRSPLIGVSSTSIEDLRRFDFRDTPMKAFAKLKSIFEGSPLNERLQPIIAHLKGVIEYTKRFGTHCKIYVNPLNSLKANFFSGGVLFQCLYDKKFKDVFAAGGRYDNLIKSHRPGTGLHGEQLRAVGFSLAWEKLVKLPKSGGRAFLKKAEEEQTGMFDTKRCDVLVASFDAHTLRTTGIEIVSQLWNHYISAEIARDAKSSDELVLRNRDESYSWIIIIKNDTLKVKTMDRKDVPDAELSITNYLSWFRTALRDRRSSRFHMANKQVETVGNASSLSQGPNVATNSGQEVHVLVAGTKSKKFNRQTVIEQAQVNAAGLVQNFLGGPIAAVETSDRVLDLIRDTALSDPESWRKAEQSVDKIERRYMREIHDMLTDWRSTRVPNGNRDAFVYNFRTTKCIYYDLGA